MTDSMAGNETVWNNVERLLSRDPRQGLNTAWEACGRRANETGRLALVVRDADGSSTRWTYGELDRLAARCAGVHTAAGLRRGDRVAAVLTRQVESLVVALAAWRAGLVYVPLYGGFGSDAMAFRIAAAGARVIVTDSRYRATVEIARSHLDDDVHVVTVGEPWSGDRSWWTEIDRADDGPAATTQAGDLATLMFTSGTSGTPKACTMPHAAVPALIPFVHHALGLDETSMLFTTADPGWSYGLYSTGVVPMALGIPRVIYTGDFDPGKWHDVIREERVTCVAAAPSAYRRLTGEFDRKGAPPSLVTTAAAGEPLAPAIAHAWRDTGAPPIQDGYGLSEVGMVLSDLRRPNTGTDPGSLAGPVPGFAVELLAEDNSPASPGEPGRIAVRAPRYQLSNGYENVPDQWTSRWTGELFVTEDLARIGDDGRWRFVGRADDMIITSGFNVSPVEVEDALLASPGVAEAAAVAAQDPDRGTVVRAVVVRSDDAPPADEHRDALRAAVKARIARFAVPRVIDFVDALPRTEVGKLRRASLRENP